jgi:DNA-binding transcriptional ArsR family regulator
MVSRYAEALRDATEGVDRLFHALADPTRRDIVRVVLGAEQSVSALAERYPMSFAAVQKHVAVLERAELVFKRRQGREQLVRADIEVLRNVNRLLDQYETIWRGRIDRMVEMLAETVTVTAPTASKRPTRKEKQR